MTRSFKLYYTPTSCGAANFITGVIGGVVFDSETVDLATHQTKSGVDFYTINPKGNVPTLVFEDGAILNENVATLTYLADAGNAGLAPKEGSFQRYRYLNHLAFVATELHPAYSPLFNRKLSPEAKEAALANMTRRLGRLALLLDGKPFLDGSALSAADVYAFVVLGWSGMLGVTLPAPIQAYLDGLKANEAIQKALAVMSAQ